MLYFVLLLLAVGASCDAADIDYEYASGEPLEGSSLDTYRYYLQESSDGDNSSFQEEDVPKKREIPATAATPVPENLSPTSAVSTQKPKIQLAALIGHVEGTIFQSALSVAHIAKAQNSSESGKTSEATGNQKRSAASIDDLTSEQDTIFKYVTSRSVPAKENQPPHYIVDEIAVTKVNAGLGPLISSLDFHIEPTVSASLSQETKSSAQSNDEQVTVSDMGVTVFVTPTHDSLVSISSVEPSKDDKTSQASVTESTSSTATATTSTSSSTTPTPTSTTLKTPIEKLKEVEDSLKEKVAEIEAEPVILSARV